MSRKVRTDGCGPPAAAIDDTGQVRDLDAFRLRLRPALADVAIVNDVF